MNEDQNVPPTQEQWEALVKATESVSTGVLELLRVAKAQGKTQTALVSVLQDSLVGSISFFHLFYSLIA